MRAVRMFIILSFILNLFILTGCAPKGDGAPYWKPPKILDRGTDYSYSKTLPLTPYRVKNKTYYPAYPSKKQMILKASWYGTLFHGKSTASTEIFDMYAYSAAHKTWPIPSFAQVENPRTGDKVIVRINDRGPFVEGRQLDLSWAAARKINVEHLGVFHVQVTWLGVEPPTLFYRLFH